MGSGILARTTAADRGLVEMPILTPHLAAHVLDGRVALRSETFGAVLSGACYPDLLPLLGSGLSRHEIVERLGKTHPALDIQTALVFLASRGYVVSTEFRMDRESAAFWSALGASPRWAEERLAAARIHVFGDAGAFPERLREIGLFIVKSDPTLSVVCVDHLHGSLVEVNRRHLASGVPWIVVRPDGTAPLFGPVFRPAERGPCWECLAVRLAANRHVERALRDAGVGGTSLPPARVPAFADAVHGLATTEIAKWIVLGNLAPLHERAVSLDPSGLEVGRHWVGRRPQCRACGDDSLFRPDRPAVPVRLRPGAKPVRNSGGERTVPPEKTLDRFRHLVGPVSGVVTRVERVSDPADPWLHVYMGEMAGTDFAASRNSSWGKGSTPRQSEASAFCEAVECVSGAFAGDEIRSRQRFTDMAGEAIHPNTVQLISDRQIDQAGRWDPGTAPDARIPERFDPKAEIDWTPVWSLTAGRHRYLPTALLYYNVPKEDGGAFCQATSNGCAAGNTLEEAVLHGFLELVERDSVAIWWFNRLRRPAVDLTSFGDDFLAEASARYRALQRDLWALDLTGDLGIPVFAAVSRRMDGGPERIVHGFGAHFDPRIAASRAVSEANQMVALLNAPESAAAIVGDTWIDRWLNRAEIVDHLHLTPDPAATSRGMADYPVPEAGSLRDQIEYGRRLVEANGMELLVLDQTRPDIGMPVVRVIVPGLRHFWRRFAPGRLYDVPVAMGWTERPLAEAELNPFPAAF